MMKSEPQSSMYISRAPELLGVLALRPITVGSLSKDLLKNLCRIKFIFARTS